MDGIWEQDWPRTIAVLDTFVGRWPGYTAAEDKLHAALVADGNAHVQGGEVSTGVDELERAARLLPGRGEAWSLIAQPGAGASGVSVFGARGPGCEVGGALGEIITLERDLIASV